MKKIFFIISLLLIYFSSISQISDSYTFDRNTTSYQVMLALAVLILLIQQEFKYQVSLIFFPANLIMMNSILFQLFHLFFLIL
jgi:hypothetical protein